MFKNFLKKAGGDRANDAKRLYAIGDVHGRADLLNALLEKINCDAATADEFKLIFLGDYVDRGPDSKGVIDVALKISAARPETVFLKGNHEAALLDFLSAPDDMYHWLDWGGAETLESYGVNDAFAREHQDVAAEFAEKIPADHLEFIKALDLTHIENGYLFVHAGVRPGVALHEQVEEDLLWIRRRFHRAKPQERPEYTVVHGHQPVRRPTDAGWRVNVDTGACWTDKLTAVAIAGEERRFLST